MDPKSYFFKVPPPPPPSKYPIKPPLPPTPATPSLDQPPPPPPPTASPEIWGNWSFDFTRPPPPVFQANGLNAPTQAYVRQNTVPIASVSPGSAAQSNAGYYGLNNQDNSHFYSTNNRQYTQRRYRQENTANTQQNWHGRVSNFRKPRFENWPEQETQDWNYYRNDSRYARNTPSTESRHSYSRDSTNDTPINVDTKHQEDGHRGRKRKKPLSQAVPAKRAWSDEESLMAIQVEKEYNKLFKNHSLKIKFPDQELNRDIVSKFHKSIETVYFQQPSNPRFCFVTLKDGVDPNTVIEELNKIPFGQGYLSAEYKKDREDEQVVGPDDIDPLTLYVGNLAQEVTKEDMVKFYPKNKRIDIGFAKKMRYTRYAFVSFKNVQDSIEAFKATHYANLHSKSMIVRFRRLHGTVGMPGEPKIQQSAKEEMKKKYPNANDTPTDQSERATSSSTSSMTTTATNQSNVAERRATSSECSEDSSNFDASLVKSEPYDYSDDGDYDGEHSEDDESSYESTARAQKSSYEYAHASKSSDSCECAHAHESPIVKQEPEFITPFLPDMSDDPEFPVMPIPIAVPKVEPEVQATPSAEPEERDLPNGLVEPKKELENDSVNPDDNEEEFNTTTDFGSVLDNLGGRPNFFS